MRLKCEKCGKWHEQIALRYVYENKYVQLKRSVKWLRKKKSHFWKRACISLGWCLYDSSNDFIFVATIVFLYAYIHSIFYLCSHYSIKLSYNTDFQNDYKFLNKITIMELFNIISWVIIKMLSQYHLSSVFVCEYLKNFSLIIRASKTMCIVKDGNILRTWLWTTNSKCVINIPYIT